MFEVCSAVLPGPRPPLVWALPLLKVEGVFFSLKELWLNRAFRFSLVRSSFLGADTGDSTPAKEGKKKTCEYKVSVYVHKCIFNKERADYCYSRWLIQQKWYMDKYTDSTWTQDTRIEITKSTKCSPWFFWRIFQFGPAPCQLWWAVSGCHSLDLGHSQHGELEEDL